jgi:hypothetical protein
MAAFKAGDKAYIVITAFHCPKTDGTFCPVFTGITAG